MKDADDTYIIVGKIGSTFGITGWLKIQSYTEFGASILEYSPWYIGTDDTNRREIEIEDGKLNHDTVVAKFPGYNNPETARQLTGLTIAIPRSHLPKLKKNEYYWSDLIGLTVINKDGTVLGKISYLMETGSNDVMVVKGTTEIAIPYLLDSVIKSIDLDKKEMHVDWELI